MHFFDNTSMKGQCKKRFLSSSQLIDSQVLINLILLKSTPPSMNFYKFSFAFKFKTDVCTFRTELVGNDFLFFNNISLIHILIFT